MTNFRQNVLLFGGFLVMVLGGWMLVVYHAPTWAFGLWFIAIGGQAIGLAAAGRAAILSRTQPTVN